MKANIPSQNKNKAKTKKKIFPSGKTKKNKNKYERSVPPVLKQPTKER